MFKRICTILPMVALLAVLAFDVRRAAHAADKPDKSDKPPPFAAWRGVESFTVEASGLDHWSTRKNNPWLLGWSHTESVTTADVRFELKHVTDRSWEGVGCSARGTEDYFSRGANRWRKGDHWKKGSFDGPTQDRGGLMIDFDTGKWSLGIPTKMAKPYRIMGHSHVEEDGQIDDSAIDDEGTYVPGGIIDGVLPNAKPGVLAGSKVLHFTDDKAGNVSHREYRAILWPTYPDVECIVEIDGYETWLPRAVVGAPTTPGSRLLVKATLKPKPTSAKFTPRASRFRFELDDTSREPGIAMNYPRFGADGGRVPDKDPNPDLKLNLLGAAGELTAEDQKANVKPDLEASGFDIARIAIESYDFGAWTNLRVICEVDDGREVPGILKLPKGPTADIKIPKRSDGSKIADVWREKYKLGPNDAEDADKDPIGDGNPGDGFSNYEEYRGFVIKGMHKRTDPNTKDLFIRNRIGDAAIPGLNLFQSLTHLAVHFELRDSEIPESRIININRTNASPRSSQEAQHGLVLVYIAGGDTSGADIRGDSAAWRPKNVEAVRIVGSLAHGDHVELDSTIAHELAHSIGVHHHGETDIGRVAWGRVVRTVDGKKIAWFEERIVIHDQGAYRVSGFPGTRIRIFTSPTTELLPDTAELFGHPQLMWVGVYGGQHSGSDQCIMRYDCSQAYVLPDRLRDRFISPGEPTGMGLCHSAIGEGINAPEPKPPRYGDASVGDCAHAFAVRDDAPERSPEKKTK